MYSVRLCQIFVSAYCISRKEYKHQKKLLSRDSFMFVSLSPAVLIIRMFVFKLLHFQIFDFSNNELIRYLNCTCRTIYKSQQFDHKYIMINSRSVSVLFNSCCIKRIQTFKQVQSKTVSLVKQITLWSVYRSRVLDARVRSNCIISHC